MNEQPSQQDVIPQQPQQNFVTASQTSPKSQLLIILLVGLLIFGVGLGGGYFLFANKYQSNSQAPRQNLHEQVQTSPISIEKAITEPTVDPSDGSLLFQSPLVNGLGYSLKYPYSWNARIWDGGGDNPMPIELAHEFISKQDENNTITLKHFTSSNPITEIKAATDRLTKDGYILTKEKNNKNIEITKLRRDVSDETDFYAYIISPKGYYVINSRDSSESHRGITFNYLLANFSLTN